MSLLQVLAHHTVSEACATVGNIHAFSKSHSKLPIADETELTNLLDDDENAAWVAELRDEVVEAAILCIPWAVCAVTNESKVRLQQSRAAAAPLDQIAGLFPPLPTTSVQEKAVSEFVEALPALFRQLQLLTRYDAEELAGERAIRLARSWAHTLLWATVPLLARCVSRLSLESPPLRSAFLSPLSVPSDAESTLLAFLPAIVRPGGAIAAPKCGDVAVAVPGEWFETAWAHITQGTPRPPPLPCCDVECLIQPGMARERWMLANTAVAAGPNTVYMTRAAAELLWVWFGGAPSFVPHPHDGELFLSSNRSVKVKWDDAPPQQVFAWGTECVEHVLRRCLPSTGQWGSRLHSPGFSVKAGEKKVQLTDKVSSFSADTLIAHFEVQTAKSAVTALTRKLCQEAALGLAGLTSLTGNSVLRVVFELLPKPVGYAVEPSCGASEDEAALSAIVAFAPTLLGVVAAVVQGHGSSSFRERLSSTFADSPEDPQHTTALLRSLEMNPILSKVLPALSAEWRMPHLLWIPTAAYSVQLRYFMRARVIPRLQQLLCSAQLLLQQCIAASQGTAPAIFEKAFGVHASTVRQFVREAYHKPDATGNVLPTAELLSGDEVFPVKSSWLEDVVRRVWDDDDDLGDVPPLPVLPCYSLDSFEVGSLLSLRPLHTVASTFVKRDAAELLWAAFGGGPLLQVHPVGPDGVATSLIDASITFEGVAGAVKLKMWPTTPISEVLKAALETTDDLVRDRYATLSALDVCDHDDAALAMDAPLRAAVDYGQYATLFVSPALPPGQTKYERGQCGLRNIGNTCYMNSALQCLGNLRVFREWLMSITPNAATAPITSELRRVFEKMWSGRSKCIEPSAFKQALGKRYSRFASYGQQDSIEVVNLLIDTVLEELNPVRNKQYLARDDDRDAEYTDVQLSEQYWRDYEANNPVDIFQQFYGQTRVEMECDECGNVVKTFDTIGCLPVSVENVDQVSYDIPCFRRGACVVVRVRVAVGATARELAQQIGSVLSRRGDTVDGRSIVLTRSFAGHRYAMEHRSHATRTDTFEAFIMENVNDCVIPDLLRYAKERNEFTKKTKDIPASEAHPAAPVKPDFTRGRVLLEGEHGHRVEMWCMLPTHAAAHEVYSRLASMAAPHSSTAPSSVSMSLPRAGALTDTATPHDRDVPVDGTAAPLSEHVHDLDSVDFVVFFVRTGDVRPYAAAVNHESVASVPDNNYVPPPVTLESCLLASTKAQAMTGAEQWYCGRCKVHRNARRTETVFKLPQLLVVQLKRFHLAPDGFTMRKMNTSVPFPADLDMRPYLADHQRAAAVDADVQYKLSGVVHHSGSLEFGHYTATVDQNGQWLDCNDSSVYKCSGPDVGSAYLLFYTR